jgi:hypothetical protein
MLVSGLVAARRDRGRDGVPFAGSAGPSAVSVMMGGNHSRHESEARRWR